MWALHLMILVNIKVLSEHYNMWSSLDPISHMLLIISINLCTLQSMFTLWQSNAYCVIYVPLLTTGCIYDPPRGSLVRYTDANWGLDFDDCRSTTGRGLADAATDITWLESLLRELRFDHDDKPTIWCDNSSSVDVAANPVLYSKFKHVELDLFFVREKIADRSLIVGEVPGCDQITDILTKSLSSSQFCRL
ncbi:hypothetical protein EPI10_028830 [Gossypium australe]|uniref:Uncharacterized protein n=1 Tax=Gossypium australe TaxID=47621 RepID=A0A5B6UYE8_9ROSI|nr:hypothetical protein EPI10_028830 [Gossypium australe]